MAPNIDHQPSEKRFATPVELQWLNLVNKLEKASLTDKLTGLFNANYWHEQLPKLDKATHLSYIITVLDLDNLKPVNDKKGHQAGNQLILDTVDIIKNSFRPEDIIIRIGGDEFVVILPQDTDKLQNEYINNNITNRLLANITTFNETHPDSPPVSLSFGSQLSLPPHNLTETFKQADQKMYQMKEIHHSQNDSKS